MKQIFYIVQVTDIPVARAHVEGVVQKLLNWAENAPPLVSFTKYENSFVTYYHK
jgi:hypothetical protein